MISDRISALRKEMAKEEIDIYIVPSMDFHHSEYVGEYFKTRQFMTGFTGSAGTAVFTADDAGLWTDGRYFIQAEEQLGGSGIRLYRMGEADCISICEFIEQNLPEGGTAGFDGRTFSVREGQKFESAVRKKGGRIKYGADLVGRIWEERPDLPDGKAFLLPEKYSGESSASKIQKVRDIMKENGADVHILSSLDDIAWLLNIRGADIAYCPLVLAHLVIFQDKIDMYADERKFSDEIRKIFSDNGIVLHPYGEIETAVSGIASSSSVLFDGERLSYALWRSLPESAVKTEMRNPEILMKSLKNETQIRNLREAHLKDGIAHTKFMFWIKNHEDPESLTEISVSDRLEQFRREQDGYLGASFAPISAFAEHGAVVHYSAKQDTDKSLYRGAMLLTDTGGHYPEGSTDITRTVALGEIPQEEKADFTLVVRAMLRLMNTVFLHGCSGANLDCIARQVFWQERVNFNHGTGHGVGYLMNIHEPPINFRWNETGDPGAVLESGMVITDEPGIYLKGKYGIRIENELLVCRDVKNEYGQFMKFEPLTFVPIDLDALLPDRMSEEEREMLNAYHAAVFQKISPHLNEKEREWLRGCTRPV